MSKKILITGGTGFIGYHLSKKCVKLGWNVVSLSSKLPKLSKTVQGVKYIKVDITQKNNLSKISRDFDYIVNLAGYVNHSDKIKTLESHYFGCKNLASLFIDKKIHKFIQIGSSIEYGKISSPQRENKKNPQSTFSYYGKAKLQSTKYLIKLHEKKKFPVTILRLYLVYGPYQDINRVIPITIKNALLNKKFDCSDGLQLRDFTFIDDVINAIIKTLRNNKSNGEIINIGSGKAVKIKDVINEICHLVGSGQPIFGKIKMRKDEIKSLYPKITKAKKLLNWQAKTNLRLGLKRTIKYFEYEKFS